MNSLTSDEWERWGQELARRLRMPHGILRAAHTPAMLMEAVLNQAAFFVEKEKQTTERLNEWHRWAGQVCEPRISGEAVWYESADTLRGRIEHEIRHERCGSCGQCMIHNHSRKISFWDRFKRT